MRAFLLWCWLVVALAMIGVGAFGASYALAPTPGNPRWVGYILLGLALGGMAFFFAAALAIEWHYRDMKTLRPGLPPDLFPNPGLETLRHRRIGNWSSRVPIDTRRGHGR